MAGEVNVNVSPELIMPIIQTKIEAAIVEAMNQAGGHEPLIAKVVREALMMKVEKDGKPDTYGYSSSIPYISWLCQTAIRQAATGAIKNLMDTRRDELQKTLEAELAKHATQTKLAKALLDGVSGVLCDIRRVRFGCGKEEI